jgi:hypothetical protein
MQSTVDVSTVVCEPAGTKRAASPALPYMSSYTQEPYQPLLQHDSPCPVGQTCSCKRRRTSNQHPALNTPNIPSASDTQDRELETTEEVRKLNHEAPDRRDEILNMMKKSATPFASTQDSNPRSGLTASVSESLDRLQDQTPARPLPQTEEIDTFTEDTDRRLVGPQQQSLSHCSKRNSKIHNFYTKASILSPKGMFDLGRVQVDERSSFNLLPWSIAMDLGLTLYSDRVLTITVTDRLVQTNQHCRFTIRVAGVDTTIKTGVISGLQTVLLGQEWIQSVNLLSTFGNQSYYIPIPLAVEAAEERFPDFGDAEVKAQDIEPVEKTMTNKISKEYDDDECGNVNCGDEPISDSELSPCELSSEDERSLDADRELSSDELSSDDQSSLDDDPSSDEVSLDDDYSSDAEILSGEELNLGEYELVPTDEDDGVSEDDEDYEGPAFNMGSQQPEPNDEPVGTAAVFRPG